MLGEWVSYVTQKISGQSTCHILSQKEHIQELRENCSSLSFYWLEVGKNNSGKIPEMIRGLMFYKEKYI